MPPSRKKAKAAARAAGTPTRKRAEKKAVKSTPKSRTTARRPPDTTTRVSDSPRYADSLSPLARAIYSVLRSLVPDPNAQVTYSQLVNGLGVLPPPNQDLRPHDIRLDEALGELIVACRDEVLPAISALVVRNDSHMPGPGYFGIAHPDKKRDKVIAMIAWSEEVERVRRTVYPEKL